MKIAVAGVGYVGLSLAVLLSQHDEVYAVSTTPAKVELINSGKSPIKDKEIEEYLASRKLNLTATTDKEGAYRDAEFVVIATPTNYDPDKNYFDTSCVEDVIRIVMDVNPNAIMVIKGAENAEELRASFGLGEKFTMLTDNLRAVLANDEDTVVIEVKQRGDETAKRIVEAWVKEYADIR